MSQRAPSRAGGFERTLFDRDLGSFYSLAEAIHKKLVSQEAKLIKDRRLLFTTHPACMRGKAFVSWLVDHGFARDRAEAIRAGVLFVYFGIIHHVSDEHHFKDSESLFYRFRSDDGTFKASKPEFRTLIYVAMILHYRIHHSGTDKGKLIQDRDYRLLTYKNCFVGSDMVTWLVENKIAATREDAVLGMNRILQADIIKHVTNDHPFKDDYLFYRFYADELEADSGKREPIFFFEWFNPQVAADIVLPGSLDAPLQPATSTPTASPSSSAGAAATAPAPSASASASTSTYSLASSLPLAQESPQSSSDEEFYSGDEGEIDAHNGKHRAVSEGRVRMVTEASIEDETPLPPTDDAFSMLPTETPKLIPGASTTRVASGTIEAHTWCACSADRFLVRVGPKYSKMKLKSPSGPALYSALALDIFSTPKKRLSVAELFHIPVSHAAASRAWSHPHIPPVLIVNCCLPCYEPSVFAAGEDGPSAQLTMFLGITTAMIDQLAAKGPASPAVELFERWCRDAPDDPEIRSRFKMIGYVANFAALGLPSMIESFNAKPVLIKKSGSVTRGPGNAYLEMDVDIHTWPFIPRKAISTLRDRAKELIVEVAVVIEGRDDDELPECILGCGRVQYLDFFHSSPLDSLPRKPYP